MVRQYVFAAFGIIAPLVACAEASAADRLVLKLNGHVSAVGAYVDQSNQDGLDDAVLAVDTGLYGSASLRLEGGGQIGVRAALDLDYATNFDSYLNDAGESSILEEFWAYWDSSFGRIQFGLQDGAADVLGFGVPSITSSIRADNPEIFLLGYPCDLFCDSAPQAPGSLFSPNGMQLRSDIHGSDDYLKVMYVSPNLGGLHLAVSYAPDGSREVSELFGDDQRNEQANIWDFAANYVRNLGEIDFGVSVGYVTGENVNNDVPGAFADLEEWGAAVKFGYRELTLGVAFRETNVAGAGPVVSGLFLSNVLEGLTTQIWSFGATYETGPWAFGANYVVANEELDTVFGLEQEGSGVQFAGAYTINENFRVSAGYQHFEFDGPSGSCPTDAGGGFFNCDTLDGNIAYLETTMSF